MTDELFPVDAMNFTGKQVLVTGGSDGIGYGVARAFLAMGATVHVTGTRSADSYHGNFTNMQFHTLDVSQSESVDALAEEFEALDVLVNCVGTVLYKKAEFERPGFEWIMSVNLTGIMHLCTSFLSMLAESGGNIINLDSVSSDRPAVNNPAYSASKAGLVQLTKALAMNWGRQGVRVNTVAPGMVPTKLTANQVSSEAVEELNKKIPLGRVGTPYDIAGAVLYLASPLASYTTGQRIVVDGGMTL